MPWDQFLLSNEEELCIANMEDRWCKEEEEDAASNQHDREAFRRREPFSDGGIYLCEVVP